MDAGAFFAALADPTRREILALLEPGEMNVAQITRAIKLAQSSVSHHLAVLRRGGLVSATRIGKEVFYRLEATRWGDASAEFFAAFGLRLAPGPAPRA